MRGNPVRPPRQWPLQPDKHLLGYLLRSTEATRSTLQFILISILSISFILTPIDCPGKFLHFKELLIIIPTDYMRRPRVAHDSVQSLVEDRISDLSIYMP